MAKLYNVNTFKRAAKKRLPAPIYHYMAGGADDEIALRENISAFDHYHLMPKQLRDVSVINTKSKILGKEVAAPLILSPTGMSRLFHHDKEFAVAKAAEKAGLYYGLSTMASTSIEQISDVSAGPKMFQIYILRDRGLTTEFVERCKASKFDALCLTVDTAMAGNRERDIVHGLTIPPKFGLKSLLSFASCPYWSLNFLLNPRLRLENVIHRVDAIKDGNMGLMKYVNDQFDRSVTWDDVAWLASQWEGPLVIKGVQSKEDALLAKKAGATALMISNHGGRQLESAPAAVDCVRPIRDAVGSDLELIVDGGVRRGNHVAKALALGADACSIGRPYLYGLAANGQSGVEQVLNILISELKRTMTLMGCRDVSDLDETFLS